MEQKKSIQVPFVLLILVLAVIVIGVIVLFIFSLSNNSEMLSKTDMEMKTSNLVINEPNTINSITNSQNTVNKVQNTVNDSKNTLVNNNVTVAESETKKVYNNGGMFVKYGNDIYYWKLNDSSRENVTLYTGINNGVSDLSGIYSYNDSTNNELIKRSLNGTETVLLKQPGYGRIFIMNERIFVQGEYDKNALASHIYSYDLLGKDKKDYKSGNVKYQSGDELICDTNDEIFTINTKTDKVTALKKGVGLLGVVNNKIYYVSLPYYNAKNIEIGYFENNVDKGIVAQISRTEFKYVTDDTGIKMMGFWEENNLINLYIGYTDGSANLVQEKLHVTMNYDGSNLKTSLESPTYSLESPPNEQSLLEEHYVDDNMIIKENGIFYKGKEKLLYEADIQREYNIDTDGLLTLNSADIIDNEIYLVIDYAKISEDDAIGWRTAYKRDKTIACIYNANNRTFTKIYEF